MLESVADEADALLDSLERRGHRRQVFHQVAPDQIGHDGQEGVRRGLAVRVGRAGCALERLQLAVERG